MYTVGAGGGMMSDGLARLQKDVADLKEAVGNGATLDPAAAQALIKALENAVNDVDKATRLEESGMRDDSPIGDTPAAKLYRPVFASVENDPDQGFQESMQKLRDQLENAIDAVKASVRSMEQTDAEAAAGFGKVEGT